MHNCLKIPEILNNIFSDIRNQERGEDEAPAPSPTLAALARTCRTFTDPALDLLWHEVSLQQLVSLLPPSTNWGVLFYTSDIVGNAEYPNDIVKLMLWAKLTEEDWERPFYYGARVRYLNMGICPVFIQGTFYPHSILDVRVAAVLPNNLCPRLTTLWCNGASDAICFYDKFICSNLQTVTCPIYLECYDPLLLNFLNQVGIRSPQIRKLEIDNSNVTILHLLPLDEVLSRTRELRVLSARHVDTTPEAIRIMCSGLPFLESLTMGCFSDWWTALPRGAVSLPHLHTLEVVVQDPQFAVQVLADAHLPSLQALTVVYQSFNPDDVFNPEEHQVRHAIERIASRLIPLNLHSFVLRCQSTDMEPNSTAERLEFSTISPLLELKTLRKLYLDIVWPFRLSDDDVRKLAAAWPLIEELHFGSTWCPKYQATLALPSLRHFAQSCPNLASLHVMFDPASFLHDGEERSPIKRPFLSKSKLRTLAVGHTEVCAPSVLPIATCLSEMFPRLESLRDLNGTLDYGWMQVMKTMEQLGTGDTEIAPSTSDCGA